MAKDSKIAFYASFKNEDKATKFIKKLNKILWLWYADERKKVATVSYVKPTRTVVIELHIRKILKRYSKKALKDTAKDLASMFAKTCR
nr:MAG TPA: hypothetical protein [Caudoviricetes sp.]